MVQYIIIEKTLQGGFVLERKACSFSGHRQIYHIHNESLPKKLNEVVDMLIEAGFTHFLSGGAIGFDLLAAECVLEKRKTNPSIRLSMVLPCRDQASRWPAATRRKYEAILAAADEVNYITEKYDSFCMHARNRALVDNSDVLICYLVRTSSGTGYTRNYAEEKGRRIVNLADLIGSEENDG